MIADHREFDARQINSACDRLEAGKKRARGRQETDKKRAEISLGRKREAWPGRKPRRKLTGATPRG
jgi:hypothetical protein